MAQSVRRSSDRDRRSGQERYRPLPLVTRRFAAWTVEVSLIISSALVPFSIGEYAKSQLAGQVPLNPVLAATEAAIARKLALPIDDRNHNVVPLTNLFWSVALVAPLALTGWQVYLLAKTGSTLPKRWFGVRVVNAAGTPPRMLRILLREGVGCWGLPLSVAYLVWHYVGAFPDLVILAGLSSLMVIAEGTSARFNRQRRCLHDLLANTYVVDANRGFVAPGLQTRQSKQEQKAQSRQKAGRAVTTTTLPPQANWQRLWWRWMRQHPSLTLLLVTLSSMAAVLGTLVGTQVYIQSQANQRQQKQQNSEQFLALVKQLSLNSPATLEERRSAILALGTLNEPQALQFLVDLLGQEMSPELSDAIHQALVSTGSRALPYLQRLNQSLSTELESERYTEKPEEQVWHAERLQATQQAIAKILVIYSGKVQDIDLSRINLGQTAVITTPVIESNSIESANEASSLAFTLVLDKIDLSGIKLTAANLNHASLRDSHLRGLGEDGRWDTFDDWIADLSDAQMQAANLTGANLSRVSMERAILIRAILNQANLAHASLSSANLSSAQLVEADLSNAILANASLTGANLAQANLTQADLYAARLGRVSALGARLQSTNLIQSNWQGADLSEADLSSANLSSANLSSTRLAGANFRNAQLENVNLRNSDLRLANFQGANLTGADFQGAIFVKANLAQSNEFIQMPAFKLQSALKGVEFTKAKNLDAKQLAYICNQGGIHPRCP